MACDVSWKSRLSTLNDENVFLKTQVDSVVKERENVKLEYQKLFNSIKATRTEHQKELDELIEHVNRKTYAYVDGKNVNTKFDKSETSGTLLCVTPLPKNIRVKAKKVSNTKKVLIVRRPQSKETKSKDTVLKNTNDKRSSAHVRKMSSSVSIDSNKRETMNSNVCQSNASVLNTKTVNAVNNGSNIVCVSCGKDMFLLSHEKCVARYALSRDFKVKRALFTTPTAAKSKNLGATSVVSKSRLSVAKTPTTTNKTPKSKTAQSYSSQSKSSICVRSKSNTSVTTQKWIAKLSTLPSAFVSCDAVRFKNDHFNAITGYGDYVQGYLTICHVYYVESLDHYLFSVEQFSDGDLEVAFRSNTCYVQNLKGDDLLTGSRESNLYTISIFELAASSPVCLMSKATLTKSWLWHRRLSHLNFACEQGKSKKASLPLKLAPSTESKLELIHMDLCGPMRVASINCKKYILVIVDDYSRYTWVYFLRTKDEALDMIIIFITQVQRNLMAQILKIQTDNVTEFTNEKLQMFYAKLGIVHNTSIARTPQQNGVVERRNHTLVEAA
ncbi:retrovirus-related pol polyprotein from transposon TNT 1-94 [Tanacetum coccineum]